MKLKLNKTESLKSKKAISLLFSKGKKEKKYPLKLILLPKEKVDFDTDNITQIVFSVPKRSHKKAVTRNLIKRRMREAYRLNKNLLSHSYFLFFIYYSKEILDFNNIETAIIELLTRVEKEDIS